MRRRQFLALAGAAAAWPPVARAQHTGVPVVGYLSGGAQQAFAPAAVAFRRGLKEMSYVDGDNVAIEYRWAEGDYERLPELVEDLVGRKVALIAASGGDLSARAAQRATSTIPIVCTIGGDPVATGLVASLARPGGNLTGVALLVVELHAKRLELISELFPQAKVFGLLVNPSSPQTELVLRAMQEASRTKGIRLDVIKGGTESEIDAAFSSLSERQAAALIVQAESFFVSRREQLVKLAARHRVPTIYEGRQYVLAGGLMSYGTNPADVYRQVGVYVGRILRGEKPADLPVMEPTKIELVVNLKAAKAIGLTIPESFLLRADEVIE
jgi:putative tryptophan/tyrosine transport system substrate-binding protein